MTVVMWERPMTVERVMECRRVLRQRLEGYDALVDAINEVELWPLWKRIGGESHVPWGNFQHLWRDELIHRFGSDGRSDSPMIES